MNNFFIVLAAGKSKRFNNKIPKQYNFYKGKMIVEHSIEKALDSKLFRKIILVISKSHKKTIKNINSKNIKIIYGGRERQYSSLKALKYLKKYNPKKVFIHDAARPNFKLSLLKKMNKHLKNHIAVVPYINTSNSAKLIFKDEIKNYDRSKILLTHTPQAFHFKDLYKRSMKNKKKSLTKLHCILIIKKKLSLLKIVKIILKLPDQTILKTIM